MLYTYMYIVSVSPLFVEHIHNIILNILCIYAIVRSLYIIREYDMTLYIIIRNSNII